MATDHALRRELSRRIRDDLIRLGIVAAGPAVRIADGAVASPGDLVVCTRNDRTVQAGEPGRTLANGDLLRIDAVTPTGLIVRRALDADSATGQRRWGGQQFLYAGYREAELGYAVTDHVAQSRTVHTGLGVIAGTEDRQHAYVVLSRGTDTNMGYVFTLPPKLADLMPGPRPAPELARYDRITGERAAQPAARGGRDQGRAGSAVRCAGPRWPAAVRVPDLAACPGQRRSPGDPERDLDRPDHGGPRAELPGPAHETPAAGAPARAGPPGPVAVADPAGRGASRPGPGQVLAAAIGERELAGARDLAAVIDARLRYRLGALVPAPAGPWSAQVPPIADPERRAFAAQIAALMDARKDRIGEHASEHASLWAVAALGPVPEDPRDRDDWQRRAAAIGAWRELSGHGHPADPIGLEPVAAAPDLRAAWREAVAALGPTGGPDVRGMPDGRLLHLRDTYPVETVWAPQYVGDELRQVRAAAREARLAGLSRRRRSRSRRQPRRPRNRRRPAGPRGQLPRPARRLPAARDRLRRHHGRPRRLGHRNPRPAPPGRRRRRRTPPPPPRPGLLSRSARLNPNPPPTASAPSSP